MLEVRTSDRRQWIAEYPETLRRLQHLDTELGVIDRALGHERDLIDGTERVAERPPRSVADELLDVIPRPTNLRCREHRSRTTSASGCSGPALARWVRVTASPRSESTVRWSTTRSRRFHPLSDGDFGSVSSAKPVNSPASVARSVHLLLGVPLSGSAWCAKRPCGLARRIRRSSLVGAATSPRGASTASCGRADARPVSARHPRAPAEATH